MRLQHSLPTPLALMAAGWACSAALANLYLRALRPGQPTGGTGTDTDTADQTSQPKPPAPARDDDATRLTPEDEVLLLHLLE